MFNSISLLLALSMTAGAAPAIEPTVTSSGTVIEQDARYATANPQSFVDNVGLPMGNYGQGGMPTYGAKAGTGITRVIPGRSVVGGVSLQYFTVYLSPGTGFNEEFIVYVPMAPQGVKRPMLMAFHKFGNTQKDITYNTTLAQECANRGWYMIAPVSASGGHMMCDEGMANTEAVMAWVLEKFSIDMTRIYGLGFSMGGGMALNYGARHLDPDRGMFAAIYNHTGSVDLVDSYENEPANAFIYDFWYGDGLEAANTADYDRMIRSSVIQYDPVLGQVNPNTNLVRNLSHVALKNIRAAGDPLVSLSVQTDRLDSHLLSLGRTPGPSYSYEILPGDKHTWDTMDETAACDWLSQFSLTQPTGQRTLASKEANYYSFYIDQTLTNKLTPFTWEIDVIANELRISETANMKSISCFTPKAGLDVLQPLKVVMTTADGLTNKVSLTGYAVKPAWVKRDGVIIPTTHWAYVPGATLVTLTEFDGLGVHTYEIMP